MAPTTTAATTAGAAAAADAVFGPQFGSRFDLTLLFENAILTILPTALIIIASPFHVTFYKRQAAKAGFTPLLWVKLITAFALLAVEIAKPAIGKLHPSYQTASATAASSLSCVAAVCVAVMLILEHRNAFQSSIPLSIYLSLVAIADVIKARSFLMRPGLQALGALCAATAVIKFILVVLQEVPKNVTPDANERYVQESTGGFWNRTLAIWVNPILIRGYSNALELSDLATLGPQFTSRSLSVRFASYWEVTNQKSNHALLFTSGWALRWPFLYPVIPRLCLTGFSFASPPLIRRILVYLNKVAEEDFDSRKQHSYAKTALIVSFVLVYTGIAVSKASNLHFANRYSTLLRGQLVSAILKKNMRLPQHEAQKSAALALMNADVEGILLNIGQFHSVWICFIEFGLAIYFLYRNIGAACFLPIITVTLSAVVTHIITKKSLPAIKDWNEAIQKRVSKSTSVFANMRSIKMLGLETIVEGLLQKLRKDEIDQSIKARKLEVLKITFLPLIFACTPLVTMCGAVFWTTFSQGLNSSGVFVLMAYLFLIYQPMIFLLNCWPTLGQMTVCFKRIQDFLLLEEHIDPRKIVNFDDSAVESDDEKAETEKWVATAVASEPLPCVVFANTSIGRLKPPAVLLHRMNFEILRGTVVMLVGPVASGKSTLLKTILGETTLLGGEVRYDGSNMAYADQRPWLPNITVRETILGDAERDDEWYSTVVKACALEDDIKRLRKHDETPIGSGGTALSGGQKQRLSLARAIYSRVPIVVLDDVLSALDPETASHIVTELLGPDGLLKSQGRTAIIATHAVKYRCVADQVLVLDGEGNVTPEAGESRLHEPDADTSDQEDAAAANEGAAAETTARNDTTGTANTTAVPDVIAKLNSEMVASSSQVKGGSDFRLYSFFLQFVPRPRVVLFLCLIAAVGIVERAPQIYLRIWVDVAPHSKLMLIGLGVIAIAGIALYRFAAQVYMIDIIPIIAETLHEMFIHSVMHSTLSYLTSTGTGPFINRASQDMTLLGQDLPMAFYRFLYISALVFTDTVIIVAGARYAALMIPIIIGVLYIIQLFYLRTSRQMRHIDLESKTPLFIQVNESSLGLEHIRSFGWQEKVLDGALQLLDNSQKPYYYLLSLQRWLGLVLDMTSTCVGAVLVAIALTWPGTTTEPSLGLSLVSVFAYSVSMMALVERWTTLETSLGAVARLRDLVRDTPVEKDGPGVTRQDQGWPHDGEIKFKKVGCQYKHGDEAHTALQNVSFTVKPGQKAVIKGRTGSGKSSLLLTLLNLIDHSGEVLIDGINIKNVPHAQLRKMISTIPQDVPEIPGTVRNNLMPFDILKPSGKSGKVHEEMVVVLLESVGLWEHILEHGGINALYDEMKFSAGQRQLFSLVRAMLHKLEYETTIVIMDEATSNLDDATEVLAQHVMGVAFEECTKLIISHRAAAFSQCDLYLEFKDGKLINEVDIGKWRVDDEISRRLRAERAGQATSATNDLEAVTEEDTVSDNGEGPSSQTSSVTTGNGEDGTGEVNTVEATTPEHNVTESHPGDNGEGSSGASSATGQA